MSEREQTVAEANSYVVSAEALAKAARVTLMRWHGKASVADCVAALVDLDVALTNFEALKATADRSEPEYGVSPHAGTASGFDQSAAAPFEHRSPSEARTD